MMWQENVVADLDRARLRSGFHHYPDAFHPRCGRHFWSTWIFPLDCVDIGRVDRRGENLNKDIVRPQIWQWLFDQLQNICRISVGFVNNSGYMFFHAMGSDLHPTSNVSIGNLQTGARVALLGLVINVVLATVK